MARVGGMALSSMVSLLLLFLGLLRPTLAVELPRIQLPGQHTGSGLSAEELSLAIGMSHSRFQSTQADKSSKQMASLPAANGQVPPVRRITRQLGGYLEYMVAQAQGRFRVEEASANQEPETQTTAGPSPPGGRRSGPAGPPTAEDIITKDGPGTTFGKTKYDVFERPPGAPVLNPVAEPVSEPVSTPASAPGYELAPGPAPALAPGPEGPWDSISAHVLEHLEVAAMYLEDGFLKARRLWDCHRSIRNGLVQVEKARVETVEHDFGHARNKVRWAINRIEYCQAALGNVTGEYGQMELQLADDTLKLSLEILVQLAIDQVIAHALSGDPLQEVLVDLGSEWRVDATWNNYDITFEDNQGARVRSVESFKYGMFSAQIKCPAGSRTDGMNTAFFLATNADDEARQSIVMEFPGSDPNVVSLNTVTDGVNGWSHLVDLGYDCSEDYHTYSIAWSQDRIMWKSDNDVLRIIDSSFAAPPPNKTMFLYLSLTHTSTVGVGSWPPFLNLTGGPFIASFLDVSVNSSMGDVPNLPTVAPDSPLYPVAVDYCFDHVESEDNEFSIVFDDTGCGGRFHTTVNYPSGDFSGQVKCPQGNTSGLLTSFYLSSLEGSSTQDEIDFEWLGWNKTGVQTNFYVNGTGGHELWLDLGFDCSEAFHNYTIRYTNESIKWFVDGELKRQVWSELEPEFPVKPVFLYGSIWNASFVYHGMWTGNWSGIDAPYRVDYQNIEITSPWRKPRY